MDGTLIAQGYRERAVDKRRRDEKSAIGLAISSWADDIIPHIIEGVRSAQKTVNMIIITIEGLKGYRELRELQGFLKENFPEIKSVAERSLKKGMVTISLKTSGIPGRLAKEVLKHPKRPFPFEVRELSDQGFNISGLEWLFSVRGPTVIWLDSAKA